MLKFQSAVKSHIKFDYSEYCAILLHKVLIEFAKDLSVVLFFAENAINTFQIAVQTSNSEMPTKTI